MKEIKIICDSEITIINLKTGYIYKDEEELKAANVDPQDISKDVVVKVTNKGLEMFKKFMADK